MQMSLAKAVLFVVFAIAAWLAVGPIVGIAAAMAGVSRVPPAAFGSAYSLLLLVVTMLMLRRDGAGLSAMGLVATRPRLRELALGFFVGAALFSALALVRGAVAGVTWTFAGFDALPTAAAGLAVAFALLFPEELLFRGYAFRRAVGAIGAWPAILSSALLFGLYHVVGSGMWGIGWFFQFAMPALGGVVFGWAAVRSSGLALPIGLHLGGNWIQASVLSFQPLAGNAGTGLFTAYVSDTQLRILYAPDFGTHVPYLMAMLCVALIVWLTSTEQPTAEPPTVPMSVR